LFRVLSSIQLDNELSLGAREIDDVATDRKLPPKFKPLDLTQTDLLP